MMVSLGLEPKGVGRIPSLKTKFGAHQNGKESLGSQECGPWLPFFLGGGFPPLEEATKEEWGSLSKREKKGRKKMQIIIMEVEKGRVIFQAFAINAKGRELFKKKGLKGVTTTLKEEEVGAFLLGCKEAQVRVRVIQA